MKKVLAFAGTRNGKTALVVLGGDELLGTFFCIQIKHERGAHSKHPVNHHMSLRDAMKDAEGFIADPH